MSDISATSSAKVDVRQVHAESAQAREPDQPDHEAVSHAVGKLTNDAIRMPEGGQARQLQQQTEQSAGAIASYMHSNNIKTMDPDKLYQLSKNPNGDVPPEVQKAATFFLQHPAIYQKIETHDVARTDGISGVGNFDAAAQGLVKVPPQSHTAPDDKKTDQAAGTLAAYMHSNNIKSVDENAMYKLANNVGGNVPPEVQKAAEYMVAHPAMYKKIETNDVKGADGISGVGNFDKAAQGLVDYHPNASKSSLLPNPPRTPEDRQARQLQQKTEQSAGTIASYMHSNNIQTMDPDKLYQLSKNPNGDVPPEVQKAATFFLQHPAIYQKIETHDVAGADGISGVGNFDAAAQGLVKVPPQIHTAPDDKKTDQAAGTLAAYMHSNNIKSVDENALYKLANNVGGNVPPEVQKAAEYMVAHPAMYKKIETNDVPGADGISGVGNFDKAAQGLIDYHPNASKGGLPPDVIVEMGPEQPSTPQSPEDLLKHIQEEIQKLEQMLNGGGTGGQPPIIEEAGPALPFPPFGGGLPPNVIAEFAPSFPGPIGGGLPPHVIAEFAPSFPGPLGGGQPPHPVAEFAPALDLAFQSQVKEG